MEISQDALGWLPGELLDMRCCEPNLQICLAQEGLSDGGSFREAIGDASWLLAAGDAAPPRACW
jgi:hypothetical protein